MTLDINNLYRKTYRNKLKLLRYKLGFSSEDALDILQDTFLKVVHLQKSYDAKKSKPETWLNYVMFSTVKDFVKKQRREQEKMLRLYNDPVEFFETVDLDIEAQDVIIYELYFCKGYSLKEVAVILELNYSTITTRVSRLKERVKKLYEVHSI